MTLHVALLTTDPPSPVTVWLQEQLAHRAGWRLSVSTDGSRPAGAIDRAILRMYALDGGPDGAQADLRAQPAHPSLALAAQLQGEGVPIANGPRSNFITCDKLMTNAILSALGLPVLPAWCAHRPHGVMMPTPAGWIVKPRWGELGEGVQVHDFLADAMLAAARTSEPQIIQHFATGARCYRLTCSPTRVLGAWEKRVDDPRSTPVASVKAGARQVSVDAHELGIADLGPAAVAAVGGDMMGVDVLVDEHGEAWVLEVNCAPGGLADAPAREQELFIACLLGELS